MGYGGITFGHVWAYQIKCMMANQYNKLIEAIAQNDADLIIAVCLRLGWNDAFKHVSENVQDANMIASCKARNWIGTVFNKRQNKLTSIKKLNDEEKDNLIFEICKSLVPDFKCYAKCSSTTAREAKLKDLVSDPMFTDKFEAYKLTNSKKHPLCEGHIQKIFNMAIKLLLCLVISAEQADALHIEVKLRTGNKGENVRLTDNNWWQEIFDKDNFDADCPLDSIILDSIEKRKINNINKSASGHTKYSQIVWSKLGTKEPIQNYNLAQIEIKNINAKTHNNNTSCNLLFDFENWN